jgi:DNA excision repair protein ERCC-6
MAMEEDDTDDQRLLHSLGVTSASIDDIERKILSQASSTRQQCTRELATLIVTFIEFHFHFAGGS